MGKPAQPNQPQGTHTEPQQHSAPSAPAPKKGAKPDPAAGMCCGDGCKSKSKRFSFCEEHYGQFKFGLITKEGTMVSDYERKFEHYQAYKQKLQKSVKVA